VYNIALCHKYLVLESAIRAKKCTEKKDAEAELARWLRRAPEKNRKNNWFKVFHICICCCLYQYWYL